MTISALERAHRVAVVGAGIVGLSTAYALKERGATVTVYEHGVPGNGQSGGRSRIFRHAHDDPRMVALARESRALWDEWGERLGVELISADGAVMIGSTARPRLAVLQEAGGVPARELDADELAEWLPLLTSYTGPAVIDEAGGAIRTRAAIKRLSVALGDALVADEVISLRPTARQTVEVRSGGGRAEFARVVVCAGLRTALLARTVGLTLPVRLAAHGRLTFAVRGDPPPRLACLQDSSGAFGEVGTYAAALPGNDRYAVGLSQTAAVREDGSLLAPDDLADLVQRASTYVARALPGLDPEPVDHRHCWVTQLPWSDDGVAVWQADNILVIAGHNLFKQAPALGRALARAAVGDPLAAELRPEARLGEPQGHA